MISSNGVAPVAGSERHARRFTGPYRRQVIPRVGDYVRQETPAEFAAAVLSLL